MSNTCYMLYILAFTRNFYHFECCMIFDVVLAVLLHLFCEDVIPCIFRIFPKCDKKST